jgi:hypothetical protein
MENYDERLWGLLHDICTRTFYKLFITVLIDDSLYL